MFQCLIHGEGNIVCLNAGTEKRSSRIVRKYRLNFNSSDLSESCLNHFAIICRGEQSSQFQNWPRDSKVKLAD